MEVRTVETEKAMMQILVSGMAGENMPTMQSIIAQKLRVNIKSGKELRELNRRWKETYSSDKLFDTDGFLKPRDKITGHPADLKKPEEQIKIKLKEEEKRTILKFDDNGIPYMKTLDIPGVRIITKKLNELEKQGNEQPLIVAGDLSGMGEFNNKYGREIADGAIEKALGIFVKEFSGAGASVGSPSGDEMWGVPKQEEKVEKIIEQLTTVLKKLNDENYEANGDVIGLNAKFYIGRKSFADVEKFLKYNQKTGEKLPPGTIVVEGALLNSKEDVVINPKEVSNEPIVRKTERAGVGGDIKKETGTDGTGYERRIETQTSKEKSETKETGKKIRELTAEEKEKLENIQNEINNLVKQRSEITGKKFIENKKPSPGSRREGESENQKPREKIYDQQKDKISINNETMLQSGHGVEWMTKQLKEKMEQTEKRLNETKNLTSEQKKDIAEILNSETGKIIWTKQSLSPDGYIAAARMLAPKEKNKEEILKDFPEVQQRILKNIQNEKEFSIGFER